MKMRFFVIWSLESETNSSQAKVLYSEDYDI